MDNVLSELFKLFVGMSSLSLLTVGGAITILPALHHLTSVENAWLTDSQFNSSIAIGQASPGPNILFIAVMGWNVGLNLAASVPQTGLNFVWPIIGALLALLGITLPSSILTYFAGQWVNNNASLRIVKAFKLGMAPIVVALLISAGWLLASASVSNANVSVNAAIYGLIALAVVLTWRTRVHLLFLLLAGAICGVVGWV